MFFFGVVNKKLLTPNIIEFRAGLLPKQQRKKILSHLQTNNNRLSGDK
jgi:hypothetical protein